jgi:hypothetical protein
MTYKNKDLQRKTTADRVKRFREKKALQDKSNALCSMCKGKKYIEEQAGLVVKPCPDCA